MKHPTKASLNYPFSNILAVFATVISLCALYLSYLTYVRGSESVNVNTLKQMEIGLEEEGSEQKIFVRSEFFVGNTSSSTISIVSLDCSAFNSGGRCEITLAGKQVVFPVKVEAGDNLKFLAKMYPMPGAAARLFMKSYGKLDKGGLDKFFGELCEFGFDFFDNKIKDRNCFANYIVRSPVSDAVAKTNEPQLQGFRIYLQTGRGSHFSETFPIFLAAHGHGF